MQDFIRRERKAGRTLAEIRRLCLEDGLSMCIYTVRRVARGIPSPVRTPGRAGHSPEFKARVLELLRRGEKVRWIATAAPISRRTLWEWARDAGLLRREARHRTIHQSEAA